MKIIGEVIFEKILPMAEGGAYVWAAVTIAHYRWTTDIPLIGFWPALLIALCIRALIFPRTTPGAGSKR